MPTTSGVSGYTANVGATENKGYEISLNGVILDNPNGLTWSVGVNLYANKNKLVLLLLERIEMKVTYGLLVII